MEKLTPKDIDVFFSEITEGVAKFDPEGRYTYVNDAYSNMLGYGPEELIGQYWEETIVPFDRERLRGLYQEIFTKGRVQFRTQAIKKSGEIFHKQSIGLIRYDENKNFIGTYCLSKDVSTEVALEASRAEYQTLYQKAPAMIHTVDGEGRIVNVSNEWLKTFGYERSEVLGRCSVEFLTEASQEKAKHVLKEFMKTGYLEGVSYQMVKKSGEVIDVVLSATCERDDEGNFIRSLAFIRDVTEFNKEEKMIRMFYDHGAQDSLSLAERLDRILKAGLEHLGLEFGLVSQIQGSDYTVRYSHSMVPGTSIASGTVFDLHETYCEKCYESEDVLSYYTETDKGLSKLPCYRKFHLKCYIGCPVYSEGNLFGTVSFSKRGACINPFSDREKAFVRFMAHWVGSELSRHTFIQKLKESEAKLSHAVEALRRSNEELENFAYVCSHDLQEPLRMVSAFSSKLTSHLEEGTSDDQLVQKFLSFILKGARNAQSLVSDLLAYAQITHNVSQKKQEEVCIVDVVASVVEGQREIIREKGVQIHVGELPNLPGNRTQFLQLFQNLITNALKFSPEEGAQISIGFENDCFFVKDNGIGIEKKYHEKVFEIFHRLNKTDYSGTGIGLATCKKIVEGKGGEIWVESEPGKGTTFFISFPKKVIKKNEEAYAYAT